MGAPRALSGISARVADTGTALLHVGNEVFLHPCVVLYEVERTLACSPHAEGLPQREGNRGESSPGGGCGRGVSPVHVQMREGARREDVIGSAETTLRIGEVWSAFGGSPAGDWNDSSGFVTAPRPHCGCVCACVQ